MKGAVIAEQRVNVDWTCEKLSLVYKYLKNNIIDFDFDSILQHDNTISNTKTVFSKLLEQIGCPKEQKVILAILEDNFNHISKQKALISKFNNFVETEIQYVDQFYLLL